MVGQRFYRMGEREVRIEELDTIFCTIYSAHIEASHHLRSAVRFTICDTHHLASCRRCCVRLQSGKSRIIPYLTEILVARHVFASHSIPHSEEDTLIT